METIFLSLIHFAAYAALASAVAGLFRQHTSRNDAHFGFAAFLPVVASAVSSLIGKKKAASDTESTNRARFDQEEAERRADFEASINSPRAEQDRMRATLKLGRLYGALGGINKAPSSLISHLDKLRSVPEFESRDYQPSGAKVGGWGLAESLVNAAGYYNPTKKKPMAMPEPGSSALDTSGWGWRR